jgi:hypothetical protein
MVSFQGSARRVGQRRLAAAGAAAAALALVVAIGESAAGQATVPSGCARTSLRNGVRLMNAYARAGKYRAVQANTAGGVPASVSIEIPPIRFTGAGRSATLPIGPCQHIFRFRYSNVHASGVRTPSPFRYIETDWNTEGMARGPNDSFSSPHFDFHYYMRSRHVVDATMMCMSTNGKTCDPFRTSYAQMRRFLTMPPPAFIPASYAPDVGSSIPMMGLHLLDRTFHYTVRHVDHSPILLYGTFDGKIMFAEASVTPATLQDAIAAPSHVISFRFRQPRTVQGGVAWPTRFAIQYLPSSGTFRAAFEAFRKR